MNKNEISLEIPRKETLYFKKEIKEDPKTMDYNAGYDLSFSGYNRETGTIVTEIEELENVWYKNWVGNEPQRFYYYIKQNNNFVGEVYAKYDKEKDAHEIGIVIKAEYRGRGISSIAIKMLCEKLREAGIKRLYHEIPTTRKGAIKADTNNGFRVVKENIDGIKKFGEVEKLVYLEKEM